jgi:hypothetical protein
MTRGFQRRPILTVFLVSIIALLGRSPSQASQHLDRRARGTDDSLRLRR